MPSGSGQVRPARRARRMHSPAAVALTPRLLAILRLDMPAAHGLSRSRILRMGNLGPGMPCSLWKRSEAMPIRGSPNGARHPPSTAGRDPSEWVVAINRNEWSRSIGTADRDHPVRAQQAGSCEESRNFTDLNINSQHRFNRAIFSDNGGGERDPGFARGEEDVGLGPGATAPFNRRAIPVCTENSIRIDLVG